MNAAVHDRMAAALDCPPGATRVERFGSKALPSGCGRVAQFQHGEAGWEQKGSVVPATTETAATTDPVFIEFDPDVMTRPQRIPGSGREIDPAAVHANGPVTGLVIIKCRITADGAAEDCGVIKPLQGAEREVVEAIRTWRFKPARWKGAATAVQYVFPIRIAPEK